MARRRCWTRCARRSHRLNRARSQVDPLEAHIGNSVLPLSGPLTELSGARRRVDARYGLASVCLEWLSTISVGRALKISRAT